MRGVNLTREETIYRDRLAEEYGVCIEAIRKRKLSLNVTSFKRLYKKIKYMEDVRDKCIELFDTKYTHRDIKSLYKGKQPSVCSNLFVKTLYVSKAKGIIDVRLFNKCKEVIRLLRGKKVLINKELKYRNLMMLEFDITKQTCCAIKKRFEYKSYIRTYKKAKLMRYIVSTLKQEFYSCNVRPRDIKELFVNTNTNSQSAQSFTNSLYRAREEGVVSIKFYNNCVRAYRLLKKKGLIK